MYSCGGLCIAIEGHVSLCRAMYSYRGPCMAVEGDVQLWRAVYLFVLPDFKP